MTDRPGHTIESEEPPAVLTARDVEGTGLVATLSAGGATRDTVLGPGQLGIELWDGLDLPRAVERLASAPPGVHAAVLDAALGERPVILVDPDPDRRAAWIAWISYALPGALARGLTFATSASAPFPRVHVTATADAEGRQSLDATRTPAGQPSAYARIAADLGRRDPAALAAATAPLEAPDALALAVTGGATDLIAPAELPHALALITDLARRGEVAAAARAAAAVPCATRSRALVAPAEALATGDQAAEPPDAEVVPAEPAVAVSDVEPVDESRLFFADLAGGLKPVAAEPEPVAAEAEPEPFVTEPEPVASEAEPEPPPDPAAAAGSGPMHSPLESTFDFRASLDAFAASLKAAEAAKAAQPEPEPPAEPEAEPETIELGLSVRELEATLHEDGVPAPAEDVVEATYEIGVTLAELEASLHPQPEPQEIEMGISLAELEALLKRRNGGA